MTEETASFWREAEIRTMRLSSRLAGLLLQEIRRSGSLRGNDCRAAIGTLHAAGIFLAARERAYEARYDPRQPRQPAGTPIGGQWRGDGSPPPPKPKPRAGPQRLAPYSGAVNPTWSPLDLIGAPAKPVAGAIARITKPAASEAAKIARHAFNRGKLHHIRRNLGSLHRVGRGTQGLSVGQKQSLYRMTKRNPRFKDKIKVIRYSDGSVVARFNKPSDNIPGAYATYEKHVDVNGSVKYMIKITRAADGRIVHIHRKY